MNWHVIIPAVLACGPLAIAFIVESPERMPRTIDEWWKWGRDGFLQYLSMKGKIPTQPEGPAQPK